MTCAQLSPTSMPSPATREASKNFVRNGLHVYFHICWGRSKGATVCPLQALIWPFLERNVAHLKLYTNSVIKLCPLQR